MSELSLEPLVALLVAFPVAGALLAFMMPKRLRSIFGLGVACLTTVLVVFTVGWIIPAGSVEHFLGGWEPPLGIRLHLDGLAGAFLLMTALIGLPVSFYARAFFRRPEAQQGASELFWPLWLVLWGGLNGLYLSADLFNLYVLIEVVGIAAVALAILSGSPASLVAGLRYLLAALVGSMGYLMGIALIYGSVGVLDLSLVGEAADRSPPILMGIALMLVGLMVKTALFPLHFWLPSAHGSAQPPISAVLSALVVKGTFFVILRLWVSVFEGSLTFAAGQMMGVLGSIAIIWGSYQAIRQTRLKLIVAHSTVGQVGFLFLLFPLVTVGYDSLAEAPWLEHAWTGGIYQALAHGFAKAAMFLAVGAYVVAIGNDKLESIAGLAGRLPMTTFAFALAGVSLIGLPPSGGFVAKWMLLKATLASGQWWWAPVLVLGSLLTAGYVFMILRQSFVPASKERTPMKVPRTMEVCALLLGLGAILIGLRAEEVLTLLEVGAPFAEPVEIEEVVE